MEKLYNVSAFIAKLSFYQIWQEGLVDYPSIDQQNIVGRKELSVREHSVGSAGSDSPLMFLSLDLTHQSSANEQH